jgi:hypothetical protein
MLSFTELVSWILIIFIDMHAEMNPEKTSSNGPRFPSTQSNNVFILGKTSDDKSSFQDKMK